MQRTARAYWPLIAWAGLLVFICVLVTHQAQAGMPLISLPGIFLSAGMLCLSSAGLVRRSVGWRRTLYTAAYLLLAVCLVLSVRLIFVQ